ncbi:MAG: hypothetical protein ACYCQI_14135 [Gammaproteobacteria bacterium]
MFNRPTEQKRVPASTEGSIRIGTAFFEYTLNSRGITVTERQRSLFGKHQWQDETIELGLNELARNQMLTQENFDAITKFPMQAFAMARSLTYLKEWGIATPEYLKLITDQSTDVSVHLMYGALGFLGYCASGDKVVNEKNFLAVINPTPKDAMSKALAILESMSSSKTVIATPSRMESKR